MRYVDNQPTKECSDCFSNYCKKCECDLTESLTKYFYLFWVTLYLLLICSISFLIYWDINRKKWRDYKIASSLYMGNVIGNTNESVQVTWYFNCDEYRTLQWIESHMNSRSAITNIVDIYTGKERPISANDKIEWSLKD